VPECEPASRLDVEPATGRRRTLPALAGSVAQTIWLAIDAHQWLVLFVWPLLGLVPGSAVDLLGLARPASARRGPPTGPGRIGVSGRRAAARHGPDQPGRSRTWSRTVRTSRQRPDRAAETADKQVISATSAPLIIRRAVVRIHPGPWEVPANRHNRTAERLLFQPKAAAARG
jgi:hypothetical protein